MAQTVTNPGARLAGLFADLGHKLKAGKISEEELVLFLKRRNPFEKVETASVIAATFLTSEYFITRPGLRVDDRFISRIISAYPGALIPRGLDGVGSFDLDRNLYDEDIVFCMRGEENVQKYAFTPDQVGALIDLQPYGKPGRLLINGRANRFYVIGIDGATFVVRVRLDTDDSNWSVAVWKREEVGWWHAGDRVFRNTRTF